jgi:transcriptional regulator GlxA family with amidase domain
LEAAFRRHRSTTPLAALQAIRLDRVRTELCSAASGLSTAAIGRRYGFTNAARFAVAYGRRFGETPSETSRAVRRAG